MLATTEQAKAVADLVQATDDSTWAKEVKAGTMKKAAHWAQQAMSQPVMAAEYAPNTTEVQETSAIMMVKAARTENPPKLGRNDKDDGGRGCGVCLKEGSVESLQSHFILTMSHWSSRLPVCFLSQGTRVQNPWGDLC